MVASEAPSHESSPQNGIPPEETRPFVRVGMLLSPPGSYSHVVAEFRDYVRDGETLEAAGERLSILASRRIRADLKRMIGLDSAPTGTTSLDQFA